MYGGAWDLLEDGAPSGTAGTAGQVAAQGLADPDEFAALCQEFPGVSSVEGLRDQRAQVVQLIAAQRRDGAASVKPLELRLSRLEYFMSLLEARQQQQRPQQQQQQQAQAGSGPTPAQARNPQTNSGLQATQSLGSRGTAGTPSGPASGSRGRRPRGRGHLQRNRTPVSQPLPSSGSKRSQTAAENALGASTQSGEAPKGAGGTPYAAAAAAVDGSVGSGAAGGPASKVRRLGDGLGDPRNAATASAHRNMQPTNQQATSSGGPQKQQQRQHQQHILQRSESYRAASAAAAADADVIDLTLSDDEGPADQARSVVPQPTLEAGNVALGVSAAAPAVIKPSPSLQQELQPQLSMGSGGVVSQRLPQSAPASSSGVAKLNAADSLATTAGPQGQQQQPRAPSPSLRQQGSGLAPSRGSGPRNKQATKGPSRLGKSVDLTHPLQQSIAVPVPAVPATAAAAPEAESIPPAAAVAPSASAALVAQVAGEPAELPGVAPPSAGAAAPPKSAAAAAAPAAGVAVHPPASTAVSPDVPIALGAEKSGPATVSGSRPSAASRMSSHAQPPSLAEQLQQSHKRRRKSTPKRDVPSVRQPSPHAPLAVTDKPEAGGSSTPTTQGAAGRPGSAASIAEQEEAAVGQAPASAARELLVSRPPSLPADIAATALAASTDCNAPAAGEGLGTPLGRVPQPAQQPQQQQQPDQAAGLPHTADATAHAGSGGNAANSAGRQAPSSTLMSVGAVGDLFSDSLGGSEEAGGEGREAQQQDPQQGMAQQATPQGSSGEAALASRSQAKAVGAPHWLDAALAQVREAAATAHHRAPLAAAPGVDAAVSTAPDTAAAAAEEVTVDVDLPSRQQAPQPQPARVAAISPASKALTNAMMAAPAGPETDRATGQPGSDPAATAEPGAIFLTSSAGPHAQPSSQASPVASGGAAVASLAAVPLLGLASAPMASAPALAAQRDGVVDMHVDEPPPAHGPSPSGSGSGRAEQPATMPSSLPDPSAPAGGAAGSAQGAEQRVHQLESQLTALSTKYSALSNETRISEDLFDEACDFLMANREEFLHMKEERAQLLARSEALEREKQEWQQRCSQLEAQHRQEQDRQRLEQPSLQQEQEQQVQEQSLQRELPAGASPRLTAPTKGTLAAAGRAVAPAGLGTAPFKAGSTSPAVPLAPPAGTAAVSAEGALQPAAAETGGQDDLAAILAQVKQQVEAGQEVARLQDELAASKAELAAAREALQRQAAAERPAEKTSQNPQTADAMRRELVQECAAAHASEAEQTEQVLLAQEQAAQLEQRVEGMGRQAEQQAARLEQQGHEQAAVLERRLADVERQVLDGTAGLERQLAEAQEQASALKLQLAACEQQAKEQIDTAGQQRAEAQTEVLRLGWQLKEAKKQAREEISQLERRLEVAEQQAQGKAAQLEQRAQDAERKAQEQASALQRHMDEAQQRALNAAAEIAHLKSELEQQAAASKELAQRAQYETQQLKEQIAQAQERVVDAEGRAAAAEAKLAALEEKVLSSKGGGASVMLGLAVEERKSLEQQLAEQEEKVRLATAALNLANQTADARWDQKRDRDRIRQLEEQLKAAQERAEKAHKDAAALAAAKPGQAAQLAAQRQMEQSLRRTASERDALREQYTQLQGEKLAADEALVTLQQQALQLKLALQQQQQAAAAQQHAAWAAAEVEKLQRELAAERGRSSELEADVNAKADELEALKDELRAAKEQVTNASSALAELRAETLQRQQQQGQESQRGGHSPTSGPSGGGRGPSRPNSSGHTSGPADGRDLRKKMEWYRDHYEKQKAELKKLEEKVAKLKKELRDETERRKKLQQEVEDLGASRNKELGEVKEQLQHAQQRLQASDERAQRAQQQLAAFQQGNPLLARAGAAAEPPAPAASAEVPAPAGMPPPPPPPPPAAAAAAAGVQRQGLFDGGSKGDSSGPASTLPVPLPAASQGSQQQAGAAAPAPAPVTPQVAMGWLLDFLRWYKGHRQQQQQEEQQEGVDGTKQAEAGAAAASENPLRHLPPTLQHSQVAAWLEDYFLHDARVPPMTQALLKCHHSFWQHIAQEAEERGEHPTLQTVLGRLGVSLEKLQSWPVEDAGPLAYAEIEALDDPEVEVADNPDLDSEMCDLAWQCQQALYNLLLGG